MAYLPVAELKKSKELGERLEKDREIVITRDGTPIAILVGIEADAVEVSLKEIRRALFSAAVQRIRERTRQEDGAEQALEKALLAIKKGP